MKVTGKVLLWVCLLVVPGSSSATQADADFQVFWEKFKTAVIKVDKNAVASLTKYPLGMSYGIRSVKSKTELVRRYKEVFNQQTDAAKCFATKAPEKDSSNPRLFTVVCPNEAGDEVVAYQFMRGKLGWQFIGLDNYNE
jgi:hypothetical protein